MNRTPAESESLLNAARQLVPTLREKGLEISRARRVPQEIMELLGGAGLNQLMRPRRFGGSEVGPEVVARIARELAKGDGSVSWVYSVTNSHDHFIGLYPLEVQEEYWASSVPLSASSYMPSGTATPAKGGYTLSGRWSFCSGIENSGWIVIGALAPGLKGETDTPDLRFFLLPKSDLKLIDDWHVMGLCGTGSKSVAVENVFVPAHRVLSNSQLKAGEAPGAQVHESPLFSASPWPLFGYFITAPGIGLARGAYDVYLENAVARAKKPDPMFKAKQPAIQMHLAEASVLIDAAELLYDRGLDAVVAQIQARIPLSLDLRVRNRRDQAYGVALLRQALDIVLKLSGGHGILESGYVQRAFRDLHALSAHPGGSWDNVSLGYGSVLLGGQPIEPFV